MAFEIALALLVLLLALVLGIRSHFRFCCMSRCAACKKAAECEKNRQRIPQSK